MKKITLLTAALGLAIGASAQGVGQVNPELRPHFPMGDGPSRAAGGIEEMLLWYGVAEDNLFGNDGNYQEFIFDFGDSFQPGDTALRDAIVGFNVLVDADDPLTEISWDFVTSVTIDTVFVQLGHENNSGQTNTFTVSVIGTDANGYPTPNNVLWTTSITTDTSFTGGANWLNSAFIPFVPATPLVVTDPYAVRIEYDGAPTDTAGFVAGFYSLGDCTTPGSYKAQYAAFGVAPPAGGDLANSYVWDQRFSGTNGYLPTPTGNNLYFDCNQNGTADGNPDDGGSFYQNINIVSAVTIDHSTSVGESDAFSLLGKVYPNPASDFTILPITMVEHGNVNITIVDAMGRIVLAQEESLAKGTHKLQINTELLSAGTYFLNVDANNTRASQAIVIQ